MSRPRRHSPLSMRAPLLAAASPAADADGVVVTWTTPEEVTLLALGRDGKDQWRRNLGPFTALHGSGSSPVIIGDLAVLAKEQGDFQTTSRPPDKQPKSCIVAVDRKTGETRWQIDRKTTWCVYATQCIRQDEDGRTELVFISTSHGLHGGRAGQRQGALGDWRPPQGVRLLACRGRRPGHRGRYVFHERRPLRRRPAALEDAGGEAHRGLGNPQARPAPLHAHRLQRPPLPLERGRHRCQPQRRHGATGLERADTGRRVPRLAGLRRRTPLLHLPQRRRHRPGGLRQFRAPETWPPPLLWLRITDITHCGFLPFGNHKELIPQAGQERVEPAQRPQQHEA